MWQRRVENVAKEAEAEELFPYKELFTTIVPEQGLVAAATYLVFMFAAASCQSFSGRIFVPETNSIAKVTN